MVVLGRDENVGIEKGDLSRPPFGVSLTVLPPLLVAPPRPEAAG
jgi:hypothetical protein